MRTELKISLLAYALGLSLNQFVPVPELFMGAAAGLCICFGLLGILPEERYQALKQSKRKLFKAR